MIKADSLTKIYYSSNNSFTALKEISFSIKKVSFWQLWEGREVENQRF